MQIHELNKTYKTKKKKRIGRGGKKGNYSGRGMKGQKSRAGHKIKPQIREMILKFPKKRGLKFKKITLETISVNLNDILRKIKEPTTITPKKLEKLGLVNLPKGKRLQVKILGSADLKHPLTIKNCLVSDQAKESILKAGGKIEEIK